MKEAIQKKTSKTCKFVVKTVGSSEWERDITIEPTDTVDALVEKMASLMIEDEFIPDNTYIGLFIIGSNGYGYITNIDNRTKTLKELGLYDHPDKFSDLALTPFFNNIYNNKNAIKVTSKQEKMDLGTLPLYEVVSDEDPVNPSKKCNRFQKTGKFVELSRGRAVVSYEGFRLGCDKESNALKATNPLERFICSNHLKAQYEQGRATNVKNILERKIKGFDTMSKEEARKSNIEKIPRAEAQNGWQGINAAEYVKIYVNNQVDQNALDAQNWYGKLSDILLDKAYLSDDENLDILISAADKLYEARKITLKQFTNVALMLNYAYELRKLPNEKGGQLNSDVKPINLDENSQAVIVKMLNETSKGLRKLCQDSKYVESQDPAFETGNNKLNVVLANNKNSIKDCIDFIDKHLIAQNELEKKLKTKQQEYIASLIEYLGEKESNRETINKLVTKINQANRNEKSFDGFISRLYDKNEKITVTASGTAKDLELCVSDILTDMDKESLSGIKDEIDSISQELNEKKEITGSDSFNEALEYVKMFSCIGCIAENMEIREVSVKVKLSFFQKALNLFASIFYLLSYRYYKEQITNIESGLSFKDDDSIFNQFNTVSEEEKRDRIKKTIDDEIGQDY